MPSPALHLLARLVPLVTVAAAACGGETATPTAETTNDQGGASGSSAGTGGTSAGTGGTSAGTGGASAGAGGSQGGSGGSGGSGGLPACTLPSGCEDKCYDRVAGEACLQSFQDADAIYERLGCKAQLWSNALAPQETQCCYMAGQCGVGRPITVAGIALTATLRRDATWC